ncbi:hypothetical protein KCP70_22095 [Salmonella enterica subsp. enterica]|nr:hypothetical protein KCP70_22095 [Salmonella enterica subsp. enterica]
MQPLVSKMLQADGVTAGSVLLVDSVNNRTNGSLNANEATETLRNALANSSRYAGLRTATLDGKTAKLGFVSAG